MPSHKGGRVGETLSGHGGRSPHRAPASAQAEPSGGDHSTPPTPHNDKIETRRWAKRAEGPYPRPMQVTIALALLTLVGTGIEAVLGFGFAVMFVPAAALIVAPRHAVAVSLVLGTIMGAGLYIEQRPRAPLRSVAPLVIGALIGTPLGILSLLRLDETWLRLAVAISVLTTAVITLLGGSGHTRPTRPDRALPQATVGFIGGAIRAAISMGGPPVVLYQHYVGGGAERIRARLYAYFFWLGIPATLLAIPAGVFTLEVLRDAAVALPGLALGIVGGRLLRPHLSEHWFWRLSMAMLVATSVLAAYGAARSLLS